MTLGMPTRQADSPRTVIHMGASLFTVDSSFKDQTAHLNCREFTGRQLSTVAEQLCQLHGIKGADEPLAAKKPKKRKASADAPEKPAKKQRASRKKAPAKEIPIELVEM